MKSQKVLLFCFGALLTVGILALFSASPIYSLYRTGSPWHYFLRHLCFGILPGVVLAIFVYFFPKSFFKKLSLFFYFFSIFLLILPFVPSLGLEIHGAKRWVNFGFFTFQPTEIVKPFLVIFFGAFLSKKRYQKKALRFWEFAVLAFPILILIFFQPNLSNVFLIGAILGSMFFVAGGKLGEIILCGAFALLIFLVGFLFFPYQVARIKGFLEAEEDPLGKGYQIRQSLIAIGSGGILGKGLMEGIQKYFYLPSPISDTIFSILAEEVGFLGCAFVALLYLIIFLQSILIFKKKDDLFWGLISVGIGIWIFLQAALHMMANLAILPFTGVPLPLISYGSTSTASILIGAGLLLKCTTFD